MAHDFSLHADTWAHANDREPSRRVLDVLDRALRTLPAIEGVRWTRDHANSFDRPFDALPCDTEFRALEQEK